MICIKPKQTKRNAKMIRSPCCVALDFLREVISNAEPLSGGFQLQRRKMVFLFFSLGILIDGSERLIRWRHGPRLGSAGAVPERCTLKAEGAIDSLRDERAGFEI
jgi:hypothetical protein